MWRAWLAVALAGCSYDLGILPSGTDATIDTPSDAAKLDAPGAFSNVMPVPGLNTNGAEDDPTLTADMTEIYFDRDGDIYYALRASPTDAWSLPAPVSAINSTATETTPEITPDGLQLFYSSNYGGNYDIYVTIRGNRSAPWGTPAAVTELETIYSDLTPTPATSTVMYLSSDRPGAGNLDLMRTSRDNATATWDAPLLLIDVSTTGVETEPWVDATETTMYFSGDGVGLRDLYVTTRPDALSSWRERMPVAEINSSGQDTDAWLSPDQRTIYFASDRSGTFDLYMATR